MGNPACFEFLLTSFLWRISPGDMQNVAPEEYVLMRSWTHILIDGINSLLGAFSKKDGKGHSAIKDLKQTAAKAGINIPDDLGSALDSNANCATPSKSSSLPQNNQELNKSKQSENINIEGVKGKNLDNLKNPQVYKAMTSSVADMKFAQYEQMGLLDLCIKQRQERLSDK